MRQYIVGPRAKPSVRWLANKRDAIEESKGFELVKIMGPEKWHYFYNGKEVEIDIVVRDRDELIYLLKD